MQVNVEGNKVTIDDVVFTLAPMTNGAQEIIEVMTEVQWEAYCHYVNVSNKRAAFAVKNRKEQP
jgi:hypothetical protein